MLYRYQFRRNNVSDNAALPINRLLAWYQFEENTDDVVGTHDGIEVGSLTYSPDVIVTDGGQSYAADPNGTSFVELTTDAYPRVGFGQGLDIGTVSFWIKTDATGTQAVIGNFNPTTPVNDRTAMHILTPYTCSGQLRFFLRDFDDEFVELVTKETAVSDNQWHHVAFTYDTQDTKQVNAYFDGEPVGSTSITASIGNFTQWQFPLTLLAQNARGTVDSRITGQMDDMKLYNYVRSGLQIAQEYYGISGNKPCYEPLSGSYDLNDDCEIDLVDFSAFAAHWLDCGRYPDCN